jgi:hypothetical protein
VNLPLTACLALVTVAIPVQVLPQEKPNFSGTWTLEKISESSAAVPNTLIVNQDAMAISITRAVGTSTTVSTHRLGIVGGRVESGGSSTTRQVWWFGDSLRFDEGSYRDKNFGHDSERSEVWSLSADGRLSVEISERRSGERTSRLTAVYKKQRTPAA